MTGQPVLADALRNSAETPLAELDRDGVVVRANQAFTQLVDGSTAGRPVYDFVAAPQHAALHRFLDGASSEWSRITVGFQTEPTALAVDRLFLVRRTDMGFELVVATPDAGDQWRALLSLSEELIRTQRQLSAAIRELERARSESEAARANAEAATRSREEFLSLVSHEVRTPLTSVIGYAARLLRNKELPEPAMGSLGMIQREALRSARMIGQLLDVSRFDSGQFTVHTRELDLREVVTEVAESLELRHLHVHITTTLPADVPTLASDPDRVTEILTNLVENAARYAGEAPSIELRVRIDADRVHVDVEDNGPGVPAGAREAIFERGLRRHSSGGGLGLGLHISRGIAELLGGTLTVTDASGGGALFTLSLPR